MTDGKSIDVEARKAEMAANRLRMAEARVGAEAAYVDNFVDRVRGSDIVTETPIGTEIEAIEDRQS